MLRAWDCSISIVTTMKTHPRLHRTTTDPWSISRRPLSNASESNGPGIRLQASSLTGPVGDDRMDLERNNMDTTQLKRIADALEEILRLVKQDMQKYEKKKN
jgi:hypothetical protein